MEQSRQFIEIAGKMLVITQLYLPELLPSAHEMQSKSRELMTLGRKLFEMQDGGPTKANFKQTKDAFDEARIHEQKAWEFAMDQAELLARRMKLRGELVPLTFEIPFGTYVGKKGKKGSKDSKSGSAK